MPSTGARERGRRPAGARNGFEIVDLPAHTDDELQVGSRGICRSGFFVSEAAFQEPALRSGAAPQPDCGGPPGTGAAEPPAGSRTGLAPPDRICPVHGRPGDRRG